MTWVSDHKGCNLIKKTYPCFFKWSVELCSFTQTGVFSISAQFSSQWVLLHMNSSLHLHLLWVWVTYNMCLETQHVPAVFWTCNEKHLKADNKKEALRAFCYYLYIITIVMFYCIIMTINSNYYYFTMILIFYHTFFWLAKLFSPTDFSKSGPPWSWARLSLAKGGPVSGYYS